MTKYKLRQFAKGIWRLKKFDLKRNVTTVVPGEIVSIWEDLNFFMLIYKKTLRQKNMEVAVGTEIIGELNCKCEKKYGLKEDDYINVSGVWYKVSNIFPREFADFIECDLKITRKLPWG